MCSWYVILAAGVHSSFCISTVNEHVSERQPADNTHLFHAIVWVASLAHSLAAWSLPVACCATPYPLHQCGLPSHLLSERKQRTQQWMRIVAAHIL